MNKELIENKYWIKIERDDDPLININYVNMKKFEGDWKNLVYHINLKASDKNHIFSFYGKNGIGKSTICKNINDEENIKHANLNKEVDPNKKTNKIYRIDEKMTFDIYSFYQSDSNKQHEFSFLYNYFKCKNSFIFNKIDMNDSYEEHKASIYINENINKVSSFVKEYINSNEIIIKGEHLYRIDCNACSLSILIKCLEKYLSENLLDIDSFFHMIKNGRFQYDNSNDNILKIFEDSALSQEIIILLKNVLIRIDKDKKYYKALNTKDNKIIKEFSKFKKDFEMMSKDIFDEIIIKENFNSFLSAKYHEIFIVNKKGIEIKISDFIKKISEGQKKLTKLFFILSEISAVCDNKSIIIADDIFDSFDNNNVIHLIALMKKVLDQKKPTILLFTHDFEIFKIINKYMVIDRNDAYIIKRIDEKIKHEQCFVKDGTFEEYIMPELEKSSLTEEKLCFYLLASAACIREDIERLLGSDNDYYLKITSLLHIKKDSKDVINKLEYLFKLKYFNIFTKYKTSIENYTKTFESYFEILDNIYNKVVEYQDVKELELNVFLAIYGRILIEKKLIEQLKLYGYEENDILAPIKRNQTKYLIEYYKQKTSKKIPNSIEELNEYLTKFIHLSRGLSYIINIDSEILLELICNARKEVFK